jgi:hypothetical protein
MASATRLSADSSVEHTVEDYQVDGVRERAFPPPVIHSYSPQPSSATLWISCRKFPAKYFFHTAGGACLPS